MARMNRTGILFSLLVVLLATLPASLYAQDLVLTGGTIIDGTGKARVQGNIRIREGKIDEIGSFRPQAGEATLDVRGLVVAPGFIDIDNHSAGVLDTNPGAPTQLMQGITTIVFGLDGEGPVRVEESMARFDDKTPALNVITFAGHNTVRRTVMGQDFRRAATPAEIQRMVDLVD